MVPLEDGSVVTILKSLMGSPEDGSVVTWGEVLKSLMVLIQERPVAAIL